MGIQSGARRQHSILNPFWKQKTPTTMLGARQLGAIVAAGLAALLGANIFAGTTSEAILDDSPSQRNHKIGSFLTSDHLDTFKSDGVVVVDSLLSESELKEVTSEHHPNGETCRRGGCRRRRPDQPSPHGSLHIQPDQTPKLLGGSITDPRIAKTETILQQAT